MKNHLFLAAIGSFLFITSCRKTSPVENLSTPATASDFVQFVIPKGEHYALGNTYKAVDLTEMRFVVRFDSSCIYQAGSSENQWDINKLYGFSDNNSLHQQFSARFGWRWSEGALRLFAYTYNNAVRDAKEIGVVPIGRDIHCSIALTKGAYVFTVEKQTATMTRLSTTETAKGYQLYPYFGGDEVAPHEVRIWIRDEK